jgi:hypothetical protein
MLVQIVAEVASELRLARALHYFGARNAMNQGIEVNLLS